MPRIMIVDDDANSRTVLRDLFEDEYDVSEASNGDECLEQVASHPPDLILLDILMPKRDGFETLRALKSNDTTQARVHSRFALVKC